MRVFCYKWSNEIQTLSQDKIIWTITFQISKKAKNIVEGLGILHNA